MLFGRPIIKVKGNLARTERESIIDAISIDGIFSCNKIITYMSAQNAWVCIPGAGGRAQLSLNVPRPYPNKLHTVCAHAELS